MLELLAASSDVAVDDRVAVFDNDGTMWCEKPNYVQLEFMLVELARAIAADPSLAEREEYRALIERDATLQAELGLECIALALVELCAGIGPIEFDDRVRAFFAEGIHRDRKVPYRSLRYVPMLELVEAPTSSTRSSSPAAAPSSSGRSHRTSTTSHRRVSSARSSPTGSTVTPMADRTSYEDLRSTPMRRTRVR